MALDDVTARPVAGRYDLQRLLGRGGMGSVWLAEDALLQRRVAVKRVEPPPGMTPEDASAVRSRVLREARAAARVAHPRLVTLFDVVEEDGVVYLVQELVEAPTLKELVTTRGPLAPSEAARIGAQLVEGLAAAHRAGVVHRDVKPANVMVLGDGGVKLADFGIASLSGDPQLTATGTIIGSPAFMAPEQATGSDVGPPADLWSLGATLYFAVEGEPPFSRADALSTLTAVLHEPPRRQLRAGAMAPVLERLLDKDPSARPDVAEAARLLEAAAGRPDPLVAPGTAEPAGSRPPPPVTAAAPPAAAPPAPAPPAPAPAPAPAPSRPAPAERAAPNPVDTQVLRPVPPRRPTRPPQTGGEPRRTGLVLLAALVTAALLGVVALAAVAGRDDGARRDAGGTDEGPSPDANVDGGTAGGGDPEPPATAAPETTTPPRDTSGARAGWKTHTDADTGYKVSYPGDWQVKDRDDTRTDFVDPETGTYLRVDWTDQPGDSPEAAWQAQSKSFASRHENYREIRIDPTTYKGHRAALWEYTYDQGGGSFHAFNLGFVTGDHGFALNFQTREERWAESRPLWEGLKDGFEIPAGD